MLQEIEDDLLTLASDNGHGWAVYVRRLISVGEREYFFYYGGVSRTQSRCTTAQGKMPQHRIESEAKADPEWKLHLS